MKYRQMKWFHFDNGSNPYGVYGDRQDEFFKMIVAWNPIMKSNDTFQCPKEPTVAYYKPVDYKFKKEALRDFAIHYSHMVGEIVQSWEDVAWWSDFFTKYGKKYGLLREFRENGII